MAKKRGRPKGSKNKVYRKTKPKHVPKPKPIRIREHELRPMIREAARAGLVEAIEHTSNFWNVSDGYKKYIEQQIALQSEALLAAVKTALRQDRELRENARLRRKA
jgi:hypothetical protein